MDPITAANLALLVLQEAIRAEPAIQTELQKLFADKADPADADWAALRARVSAFTYERLVPHTQIPPGQ